MANECLVTKLKGVVDNNNLPVLSCIKIHVNSISGNADRAILLTGSSKAVIKNPDAGVYFTDANKTANYGLEATPEYGYQTVQEEQYVVIGGTGACDVLIYDKYNVSCITLPPTMDLLECSYVGGSINAGARANFYKNTTQVNNDVDLGNIFGGSKFFEIFLRGDNAYFNIKMLPYLTEKSVLKAVRIVTSRTYLEDMQAIMGAPIETLEINNSLANEGAVTAEIVGQFIHLTNLTTKLVLSTFGAVETFVATQRSLGRTTCEGISWMYAGWCNATFNGQSITQDENIRTLSWTATTITFDGVTINA